MTRHYCRYCGRPIYKFLVGWLHRNEDGFPFPSTAHIARPR